MCNYSFKYIYTQMILQPYNELHYDTYVSILACLPPDTPDVLDGKSCGSNGCINGNKGYSTLLQAWGRCAKVPHCGFVMRWNDDRYYLRRSSDPYLNQNLTGYVFPSHCGIHCF